MKILSLSLILKKPNSVFKTCFQDMPNDFIRQRVKIGTYTPIKSGDIYGGSDGYPLNTAPHIAKGASNKKIYKARFIFIIMIVKLKQAPKCNAFY